MEDDSFIYTHMPTAHLHIHTHMHTCTHVLVCVHTKEMEKSKRFMTYRFLGK